MAEVGFQVTSPVRFLSDLSINTAILFEIEARCFRTVSVLIFPIDRLLHIEIIYLTYRNTSCIFFQILIGRVEGADGQMGSNN
jgi:hypothetical protein